MSEKNYTDPFEQEEETVDAEERRNEETQEAAAGNAWEREEVGDDREQQLAALQRDYNDLKDKYLRLLAEFENYKKRTIREKMEFMNMASRDTLAALLPVLDDFDRAKKIAEDPNTNEGFTEGVRLVYNKLYNILRQQGLEAMDSTGRPFDPELHEAVTEVPAPAPEMKGTIIDTVEKGYKLKDKIIRHAKVVVGK